MDQPTQIGLEHDEEMEDLFGTDNNDVDAVKHDNRVSSERTSERGSTPTPARNPLEYDEDDQPPVEEVLQRKEADVSIPNIPVPHGTNGENWVIRIPNYVTVDPKPFHPDTYIGPGDEGEEYQHPESLRLKVENTIRWRWAKDEFGQDVRQSNSRIIRWSDGTLSLRLGKELFDINQSRDTSGGIPRQSFGGPQASQNSVLSSPQPVAGKTQGLTYLVAQHKRSQVLQAEALVTGYMSICPTGMQSETHRMLVRAVGQKHNKVARLRMAPDPTTDPEKEKMDLMKLSAKKSKKRAEDDGFGGRRRRTASPRKRQGQMWSDDEEEGRDYGASDEGDGSEGTPRKKRKSSGDEGKKGGEYQEDDFLVADSTDEEGGPEALGKKNRKGPEQEMEEDMLDKLDATIQEQVEQRRRKRDSAEGITVAGDAEEVAETDKGGEEEMDVESEEDEDEPRVRRSGTSGRKKRAIDFEEEDDE